MPRNKYPEETKQKILDAALQVFLTKGYEQTSILDIVENMGGLTRGAFYHHFKSKDEVLDALGDQLFYDNNPFEKAKQQTQLNGLEKIKYIILDSMEESEHRKLNIKTMDCLNSPTFLKRVIDDNRDLVAPSFEALIEEGRKDGSIDCEHPKLLSQLLVFLTNFWTIPTLYPATPEESIEKLLYIKKILDKMGLPILEDSLVSSLLECDITDESQ